MERARVGNSLWAILALLVILWGVSPVVRAAPVPIWVLVAVAFDGDEPTVSRVFGPMSSQAECEDFRKKGEAMAKAQGVEVWGQCIEVKRDPAVKVLPKPQVWDGDGPSYDGKRIGGKA